MVNIFLRNVYVINLERSKDRLQHIDTNLKKFGIKYQRFNAVDGKKLSINEINNNVTTMCRYFRCTRSVIGNGMSHVSLFKKIMTSKSPNKWHLVLEDDAEFTDETIKFLNELSNTTIVNEDNIFINLACHGILCKGTPVNTTSLNNDIIRQTTEEINNNLLEENPIYPYSTAAYLITKNTAKKLYDYFIENKIQSYGDMQIVRNVSKLGIKYYVTHNNIINLSTDSNTSTIASSGYKPLFLLNKLLKFLFGSSVTFLEFPLYTLDLKVPITRYGIIFLILLALNIFIFGNIFIYIYLLLELTITIILSLIY